MFVPVSVSRGMAQVYQHHTGPGAQLPPVTSARRAGLGDGVIMYARYPAVRGSLWAGGI